MRSIAIFVLALAACFAAFTAAVSPAQEDNGIRWETDLAEARAKRGRQTPQARSKNRDRPGALGVDSFSGVSEKVSSRRSHAPSLPELRRPCRRGHAELPVVR